MAAATKAMSAVFSYSASRPAVKLVLTNKTTLTKIVAGLSAKSGRVYFKGVLNAGSPLITFNDFSWRYVLLGDAMTGRFKGRVLHLLSTAPMLLRQTRQH